MGYIVPYVAALVFSALVSLILAVITASSNRAAPGSRWATALMVGICMWSASSAAEWAAREPATQLLWARVVYIGIVIVPAAWFGFALTYTGHGGFLRGAGWAWLTIEPFMVLTLVWTNDQHSIFWSNLRIVERGGYSMLQFGHGPAFWAHATYSYALLAVGAVAIFRAVAGTPHLYRGQAAALLVGVLAPWLANVLYVTRLSPWPEVDPTPLAFTVTGLALTCAMVRYSLWRLSPVARAAVVEGMRDSVFVFDEQGRLVDLNPAAQRIVGRSARTAIGQTIAQLLPGRAELVAQLSGLTEGQWEIALGEGDARGWYDMRVSALHNGSGRLGGHLIVLRDISEIKRTEEQLLASEEALRQHKAQLEELVAERTAELRRANERLQAEVAERREIELQLRNSLHEKEVLLQEVHHRVKNNLQVVSSLLNLQAGAVSDPGALDVLQDSQRRVRSMALIHEKLYRSKNLAEIDFGDYIRDLIAALLRAQTNGHGNVDFQVDVAPILLPLGVAMPCGLILNELVSNALKHAFPGGRGGEIYVSLSDIEAGQARLIVADNGIGLPDGVDWRNSPSLGLQLVNTLVDQLEGSLTVQSAGGTRFEITFPIPASDRLPPLETGG
jgi:PAS domain S-box-containing protein